MGVVSQNITNRYVKNLLYWSLVIAVSGLLQVILTPPLGAQKAPAANQVAVYEHINYVGDQLIYTLEPGMRQKIVRFIPNPLAGKISSIQVGANVGVAFWNSYDFYGDGNATFQSINNLSVMPTYHDKIMSLIIFPKEWKYPMGVLIIGKYLLDSWDGKKIEVPLGKFYPAPEKMTDRVAPFPDIGYEFINNNTDAHVRPDSLHPVFKQVSVKLCEQKNFGGKCITIPGPGGGIIQDFKLSDYQFENKVASLQVIHTPVTVSIKQPTTVVKPVPPARTQVQKAPPPIAVNEVALWENVNYGGNKASYKLEPGMRQKLVYEVPDTLINKTLSIQVGANVGVAFWTYYKFYIDKGGKSYVTLQSINNLSSIFKYNDKARSLIIFPKEWKFPVGALLEDTSDMGFARFFPQHELMAVRKNSFWGIEYKALDNAADVIHIWPDNLNHPIHNQVVVRICENQKFTGKCITLPGGSSSHTFQLSNYQLENKVSSIEIIDNSPIKMLPTPSRTPTQTPTVRMPVQRR